MSCALSQYFQQMQMAPSEELQLVQDTAGALASYRFHQRGGRKERRRQGMRRWDSSGSLGSSTSKNLGLVSDLSPQRPRRNISDESESDYLPPAPALDPRSSPRHVKHQRKSSNTGRPRSPTRSSRGMQE
ncbi:expressed unknown protein [Seminavis robusta]|uniref:Uncharacterized protein n=1 Tax=Seminavis robusta TaxID=568900 RepID=A0A9N8H822_9STRA|nr:expressed unknown protein [Seminavis robusta]|eukprot:Sro81_g043490.1 n/a (130) ;mRNA; r:57108-57497